MIIEEKRDELLSLGFPLGNVTTSVEDLPWGGRRQAYENAIIYENPEGEAYEVHGAILGKYIEFYEMDGDLGFPASDEIDDEDVPGGRINFFDRGYISWTPAGGAEVNLSESSDEAEEANPALTEKLNQIAEYAFSMLSLPLRQSKNTIEIPAGSSANVSWCGYTVAHFYRQAGADEKLLSKYFGGVAGLLDYGSYYRITFDQRTGELITRSGSAKATKIADENGEFVDLEQFHSTQNALRKITLFSEIQQGGPLDIIPGDIVLFDHKGKAGPDHIQIVYSWDEADRVLIVIDGNGASFVMRETGASEATLSESDISKDGIAKVEKLQILNEKLGVDLMYTYDSAKEGRFGITMHRLVAANQINTLGINSESEHARIWALIRPSVIDFEPHKYTNL